MKILKKNHLMACKRFLGVSVRTPNKMVYGDLGRLLEMGNDRLPKTAHERLMEKKQLGF